MTKSVPEILVEALPYIRQFSGKTVVIKYGGHAMVDDALKTAFASDVTLLKYIGINVVVVHGGGPQINRVLNAMGITTTFVKGMRYTDDETMDVVEMVLGGKVNKEIVSQLNRQGGRAAGLTGKDGGMIIAEKMTLYQDSGSGKPPEIIDTGKVGKVAQVNPDIIHAIAARGFIPVIAPVGVGLEGETYNINADLVASAVACAINAERLILLTDVDGILDADKELISSVDLKRVEILKQSGTVAGGMIPKLACAAAAVEKGVKKAHIINGTIKHAVLLELFTDSGIGTQVFRGANGQQKKE